MILDIVLALVISFYLLVDGQRIGEPLALVPSQHRAKAAFLKATRRLYWVTTCAASSSWR